MAVTGHVWVAIWVIETLVNKQGNLTPLRLISISMSRPGGIIQSSRFANVRGKHGDRAGSNTRGVVVQGTEVWQYQYLGSHCLDPPIHPPVLGPDTEIPDPVGGTVPLHRPALEGALHPSNLDPRGKQGQWGKRAGGKGEGRCLLPCVRNTAAHALCFPPLLMNNAVLIMVTPARSPAHGTSKH